MALTMNIIFIAFGIVALGILGYLAYVLINGALNDKKIPLKTAKDKGRSRPTDPTRVSRGGLVPAKFPR